MLLAFVDSLLHEAQITLNELDAIAFGAGPGSFTGIRIAAAMVQGLAFGAQKPVLPISSLRAMAYAAFDQTHEKNVAVALDARKSEIYWGLYQWDEAAGMLLQGEESVVAPNLAPYPVDPPAWIGAGNGFQEYAASFQAKPALKAVYPDIMPQAAAIVTLAALDFLQGKVVSAEHALPTYIRDNVV
jgi:tRNA threonylcarbamoyladenosine biosynthesis protein TsaB